MLVLIRGFVLYFVKEWEQNVPPAVMHQVEPWNCKTLKFGQPIKISSLFPDVPLFFSSLRVRMFVECFQSKICTILIIFFARPEISNINSIIILRHFDLK